MKRGRKKHREKRGTKEQTDNGEGNEGERMRVREIERDRDQLGQLKRND